MKSFVSVDGQAVTRLLPMSLLVAGDGLILTAGPTLRRMIEGHAHFDQAFSVDRPRNVANGFTGLGPILSEGGRLFLRLRNHPTTVLRGHGVPLADGGAMLNFGFGVGLPDAVRNFGLTDADFTPADLAMELLFLHEANATVQRELANFNLQVEQARRTAEEQAYTDSLTGLYNRRGFDISLEVALREAGRLPFAVLQLDLDLFKEVNDRLGHAAGDVVLRNIATILRSETRSCDTVARVGGDEFILILPTPRMSDHLSKLARRIITRIEQPMAIGAESVRVSASIGITESALYDEPDAAVMLADADAALYVAKKTGRGRAILHRDIAASDSG